MPKMAFQGPCETSSRSGRHTTKGSAFPPLLRSVLAAFEARVFEATEMSVVAGRQSPAQQCRSDAGEAVCGPSVAGLAQRPRPEPVQQPFPRRRRNGLGSRTPVRRRGALVEAWVLGLSKRRTGSRAATCWVIGCVTRSGVTFTTIQTASTNGLGSCFSAAMALSTCVSGVDVSGRCLRMISRSRWLVSACAASCIQRSR